MKRYCIPAVAVAAVVATPITAHAVTVDFSFNGSNGGTVSGYLVFASPDGAQDPTSVHVTSAPAPFLAPVDFFSHGMDYSGGFTLSHGVVKAAYFLAFNSGSYNNNTHKFQALGLNKSNGAVFYSNESYFFAGNVSTVRSIANVNGFSGVTFSTVAVPEPSSIALLGAGLTGISMFRRRRARTSS